jgi:hypothetical protein
VEDRDTCEFMFTVTIPRTSHLSLSECDVRVWDERESVRHVDLELCALELHVLILLTPDRSLRRIKSSRSRQVP